MGEVIISYETLAKVAWRKGYCIENLLEQKYSFLSNDTKTSIIKSYKEVFLPQCKGNMKSVFHDKKRFFKKYEDWLKNDFIFQCPAGSELPSTSSALSCRGRPEKGFDECSNKAKNIK